MASGGRATSGATKLSEPSVTRPVRAGSNTDAVTWLRCVSRYRTQEIAGSSPASASRRVANPRGAKYDRRAVRLLLARAGILGAVALVGVFLLPAAGTPRAIKEGGTFRVAEPDTPASADPAIVGNFGVFGPACGTLMWYPSKPLPEGLRLMPDLAASNPHISQGGSTYTFLVRRSARFSTGQPVTAADVKHSLERILTPALQSGLAYLFEDVVGARRMASGKATSLAGVTANGRTVTIRLVRSVPDLPARTTQLCIVPRALQPDRKVRRRRSRVRGPTTSPSSSRARASRSSGTRTTAAGVHTTSTASSKRPASSRTPGSTKFRRGGSTSIPWCRGRGRASSSATTASIARGSSSSSRLAGEVSSSTRAGRCSATTSRSARRSTSLSTAPPSSASSVGSVRRRPIRSCRRGCRDSGTRRYTHCAARTSVARGRSRLGISAKGRPSCTRARIQAIASPRPRCSSGTSGPSVFAWRSRPSPSASTSRRRRRSASPTTSSSSAGSVATTTPGEFLLLFDGRSGAQNYSRFNSPAYNRLLDVAGHLSGPARYKAYGSLDVRLMRDEAPAIPYAVYNDWTFVSDRVGCVVKNPSLDLTAVCLK